jgi:hypothetical protein
MINLDSDRVWSLLKAKKKKKKKEKKRKERQLVKNKEQANPRNWCYLM